MGRLGVTAAALGQWVRGGLVVVLVVLMAAAGSGALGTPAWANAALPYVGVQQSPDNDGGAAITLNVNSTLDEVDASPGDGTCASAANRCTLRAAVMEANARGGRHTINVPAGTYTLTIAGINETNSATGDLNIRTNITIIGAGASSTMIDGNQLDRVFSSENGVRGEFRSLTIRNGKTDGSGGGIFARGNLSLISVVVRENIAAFGGGISGDDISVLDSAIVGNSTTSSEARGGGIYAGSSFQLIRSTISGNSAPLGAGIYAQGQVEVTNSTISGNTAAGDGSTTGVGGGLYYDNSSVQGTLTNVTIANNSAPRGSGIYKGSGTLEVKNTIVATNTGSAECFRAGSITSLGNNIDGGTGCGFTGPGDRQNTNPNIGPLADNGGPTRTHALQNGSPAIDGGTNTGCPSVDQRGIQRPRDGDGNGSTICDIGAFEAPGTLGTLPAPADNDQDGDNSTSPIPTPIPNDNRSSPDNDEGGTGTPGQTTVQFLVCPGTIFVHVHTLTGFAIGDTVRINPGGATQEDARVVDVGCNGRNLHLAGPLQFRHLPGEAVVVVASSPEGPSTTVNQPGNDDREREQSQRRTEEQRQQAQQTNRSGRDDLHTEGDVAAVDLAKQPPEVVILTRDGRQTVQLLCGDQCPTVRVGDYIEVDGTKEHEGLFYAENVKVTRR